MGTNGSALAEPMIEAIGDPSRRAIVTLLCERPSSVTALAEALPVSRPAVSQHLRVLKDVGLVEDEAQGTKRIYRVRPDALAALRAYFDDFWQQSLMAFRLAAEAAHDTDRPTRVTDAAPDPEQEHP